MVRLEGVSYRHPGATSDALRGLDLTIPSGKVTLVTGPLGSGCSTLLLLAADLAPRVLGGRLQGAVTVLGETTGELGKPSALTGRVGLLLPTPWTQLSGMSFTVREEVAFGPSNLGRDRTWIEKTVADELERLQVSHLADRDPSKLSGGELQKVMMAAMLAMDPDIILLDEPGVELDPSSATLVYGLLPELARDRTVVVASTDIDRIWGVADHAIVLHEGQLLQQGDPGQVFKSRDAVGAGVTTSVGQVYHAAGVDPVPLTVAEAVGRRA